MFSVFENLSVFFVKALFPKRKVIFWTFWELLSISNVWDALQKSTTECSGFFYKRQGIYR